MKRSDFHCILMVLVAAAVACTAIPSLGATVAANFTDGNGETAVDAYNGMAGLGWGSAWGEATLAGSTLAAVVKVPTDPDYAPLEGGGQYLHYELSRADAGLTRGSVARNYAGAILGINTKWEHTITFKLRIDEDILGAGTTFTDTSAEGYDSYNIFDFSQAQSSTGTGGTWQIVAGPWYAQEMGTPLTWVVSNGNGDGTWNRVDTGILLQKDTVYDFAVHLRDAALHKWDVTISDGTNTYDSRNTYVDGLGARSTQTAPWSFVNFNARGGSIDDVRKFSLDAVAVQGYSRGPGPVSSPVVARFNDGNDDTLVDGYHGIAGSGWETPWVDKSSKATVTTRVVEPGFEGVELKTGLGRYLSHEADNAGTGTSTTAVNRSYTRLDPDPGIDWTQPHKIQFTIRIDENVDDAAKFTDLDDRYGIADTPGAATGGSATSTWMVHAFSKYTTDNAIFGSEVAGEWSFYDGNHDGVWDKTYNVNTDIAVQYQHVYDFTIVVDPTTQTYDATVTDVTNPLNPLFSTVSGLGWRSSSNDLGGNLCFFTRANAADDARIFSLDELIITQLELPPIPGDATGDRKVDAADAQRLAEHWGATELAPGLTWWQMGDFDHSESLGAADASILAANWGFGVGESGSAVPEPSTILLLLGGSALLLGWRKR